MNNKIILVLLLVLTLAVGCKTNDYSNGKGNGKQLFCTDDAKICPDGKAVGRDANNNCEFFECSNDNPIYVEPDGGIGLTDPYIQYVSYDRAQCAATDWMCIEGSSQFFDDAGCGCKADVPKKYVSKSSDECSTIRYMCENNYVPFSDSDGCGCEFTFGKQEADTQYEGKLRAINCEPEQRKADFCTEEYAPVCGWSDPAKIQCIRYPCAQTFSNICNACKDENVAYYTVGECPSGDGTDCTCPQDYRKEGESCNPECYYSEPKCLAPSIKCETVLI